MSGYIMGRRAWVVLAAFIMFLVATPTVAGADCAPPPDIEIALAQTETAFVGEVIAVDFDGRVATFEVLEVWKGILEQEVIVNGGPDINELTAARAEGEEIFTSGDRSYALGEVYLVLAQGGDAFGLQRGASARVVDAAGPVPPARGEGAAVQRRCRTAAVAQAVAEDAVLGQPGDALGL